MGPPQECCDVAASVPTLLHKLHHHRATADAGLDIMTIPLVLLFLLATKQIVAGLMAGMTK